MPSGAASFQAPSSDGKRNVVYLQKTSGSRSSVTATASSARPPVRRDELEGSGLPALTDFLNTLKGASRPELIKFGEKIGEALDDLPQQLLNV